MAVRDYSQQGEIWGPSPDLALPKGHVARALDEIIEKMDLDRYNERRRHTPGEAAYDVRGMVKILIYAYSRGITSSREMARQCEENIAFQFLARGHCPDFRTIALFRRNNRDLLRFVFGKTVELAREMGIVRLGLVAIDGVKLTANASPGRKMTKAEIEEELRKLDAYLGEVESSDRCEDGAYGADQRGDELPAEIQQAQLRKEKLEKAYEILRARETAAKREKPENISPEDPEAAWVKNNGKIVRGYNGHVAADAEEQVIVAVKATAEPVDSEQLNPMVREVEKTAGELPKQVVADSGYYTDAAMLEAAKGPTECIVPDSQTAAELNNPKLSESDGAAYHANRFVYNEERDEFTCPQGKTLRLLRNRTRRGEAVKIYRCADCHDCPARAKCTESATGLRSIELRADHASVRKLREKFNTAEFKAIYRRRKAIVEPIFGRWKHNWGIRRLRLRGLAGFSLELHLLAIAHNVAKLFTVQQRRAAVAVAGQC